MMRKQASQSAAPPASSERYGELMKVFDRGLMMQLDKFGFRMKAACDKLASKVDRCEAKLRRCFNSLMTNTTRDLDRK